MSYFLSRLEIVCLFSLMRTCSGDLEISRKTGSSPHTDASVERRILSTEGSDGNTDAIKYKVCILQIHNADQAKLFCSSKHHLISVSPVRAFGVIKNCPDAYFCFCFRKTKDAVRVVLVDIRRRRFRSRGTNLEIPLLKAGSRNKHNCHGSSTRLLSLLQDRVCAQTPDDARSHAYIYTHLSPPLWSSVSARRAFLERSLHLFSRCGDRSCWQSLVAAFTRDPLGPAWNTAAPLIASRCAAPWVDFHLHKCPLFCKYSPTQDHLLLIILYLNFSKSLDGVSCLWVSGQWYNMAILQHLN